MLVTPCGTVHVPPAGVEVNRSTMYFVPFAPIVPLPTKDVRPPLELMVFEIVTNPEAADALRLPAASEKDPEDTVTVPVPLEVPNGVKRTLYAVELVEEKSDRVP